MTVGMKHSSALYALVQSVHHMIYLTYVGRPMSLKALGGALEQAALSRLHFPALDQVLAEPEVSGA
jgi:hypothetical protein